MATKDFVYEISIGKVFVTRAGVALFNARWPASGLRDSRAYWFEFDIEGHFVDSDVPECDDGPGAAAMANDCEQFFLDGTAPEWVPS